MVNSTKPPKQEKGGERDNYTVLIGLPYSDQVTFKNARRKYEIAF